MINIFVYNELMQEHLFAKSKCTIHNKMFGETTGRLYNVNCQPMLIINDFIKNKSYRKVFGMIYTIDDSELNKALYFLDSLHHCSSPRIFTQGTYDLMFRTTIDVYPITFRTKEEFINYKYCYEPKIKCITWVAHEEKVKRYINLNHKLMFGLDTKTFKKILKENENYGMD